MKTVTLMRMFPAGAVLGVLAMAAPAQEQEVLVQRREAKLVSEFLRRADWILDYDRARAEAARTGRPIFAYFSRSFIH